MRLLPPYHAFKPFAEVRMHPERAGRWRGRGTLHVSRLQDIRLSFTVDRIGSRLELSFDSGGYMHAAVWTWRGGRWYGPDGAPLPPDPLWAYFLAQMEAQVLGWHPRVAGSGT